MRDRFGRWVSSLRPKDIEKIAEGHFGYAPEGLGEQVQKSYAKLAGAASGKDADIIERFTALTPEGAEARRVVVAEESRSTTVAAEHRGVVVPEEARTYSIPVASRRAAA
jgi:hypothetical protein